MLVISNQCDLVSKNNRSFFSTRENYQVFSEAKDIVYCDESEDVHIDDQDGVAITVSDQFVP